jgi:hypothetical protein
MGGVGGKGAWLEQRIAVAHGWELKLEDAVVLEKYRHGGFGPGGCPTSPIGRSASVLRC